jgi:flagellar biosynthesis/type III secretory pathway protein FliH
LWSDQVTGTSKQVMPVRIVKAEQARGILHAFPSLGERAPLAQRVTQMIDTAAVALQEAPATAAVITQSYPDELITAVHANAMALRTAAKEEAEATVLAARTEAESLRNEAQRESDAMLLAARLQADQTRAEAEERTADLLRVAKQEAEELIERAKEEARVIVAEAQALSEAQLEALPGQVVRLSLAVAAQILRAELAMRSEAALPMVEAALTRLKGELEPRVRVAPDSLALLEAERGRLLAAAPGARQVRLEADPAMAQGDFQVHGALGWVDGRIDRQLSLVQEAIEMKE